MYYDAEQIVFDYADGVVCFVSGCVSLLYYDILTGISWYDIPVFSFGGKWNQPLLRIASISCSGAVIGCRL